VKYAAALVTFACVCATAVAQDEPPKKPDPAPNAPAPAEGEKKPEAKKERKCDEAGMKALSRHASLVHLPAGDGLKELSAKGELEDKGETIEINPRWSVEKGFDFDMTLPDQIKQMAGAQGMSEEDLNKMVKKQLGDQLGLGLLFETPEKNWAHFDVACKQEGDDQVVDLTPFDEHADADSRKYVFGKDGLLKSSSMAPKSDTPQGEQMKAMGIVFDSTWSYEKKGEKSVVTSRTMSVMGMDIESKLSYYDGPNGSCLPKAVTIAGPQGDVTVSFHDYTVDGKFVEATKKAAPERAAGPAPKAEEKPAEKPAEKPPEPTPTPKDEPK
jgi:hypothetical protein